MPHRGSLLHAQYRVRGGSRHASRAMPRARSTSARAASRGCAIDSMRETEGTLHERRGRPRSTCVIVERVSKWEWVSGRCTVLHCMGVRPLQRHMRRPSRVCGCGSVRTLREHNTQNRVCHTFTVCAVPSRAFGGGKLAFFCSVCLFGLLAAPCNLGAVCGR